MSRIIVSIAFVIAALMSLTVRLAADDHESAQRPFAAGRRVLVDQFDEIASRQGTLVRRAATPAPLRAHNDDGTPRTAKKSGRKGMWITIAASAAGLTTAMLMAPKEAPIPTNPTSSYQCTSFARWGTLMTSSGYTCVAR